MKSSEADLLAEKIILECYQLLLSNAVNYNLA